MSFSSKLLTLSSKMQPSERNQTESNPADLKTIKSPTIDGDKAYLDALKYSNMAAGESNQKLANREWQASQQSADNYQKKTDIDTRAMQQRAGIQNASQQQNSSSGGGGGTSLSGGYTDGLVRYDYESTGSPYLPSSTKVARKDKDVAMAQQQQEWNRQNAYQDTQLSNQRADADRSNQQAMQSQRDSAAFSAQGLSNDNAQKLAKIGANAQIQSAGLQAQGNILGSLFSSVGSGNPNYKFWS